MTWKVKGTDKNKLAVIFENVSDIASFTTRIPMKSIYERSYRDLEPELVVAIDSYVEHVREQKGWAKLIAEREERKKVMGFAVDEDLKKPTFRYYPSKFEFFNKVYHFWREADRVGYYTADVYNNKSSTVYFTKQAAINIVINADIEKSRGDTSLHPHHHPHLVEGLKAFFEHERELQLKENYVRRESLGSWSNSEQTLFVDKVNSLCNAIETISPGTDKQERLGFAGAIPPNEIAENLEYFQNKTMLALDVKKEDLGLKEIPIEITAEVHIKKNKKSCKLHGKDVEGIKFPSFVEGENFPKCRYGEDKAYALDQLFQEKQKCRNKRFEQVHSFVKNNYKEWPICKDSDKPLTIVSSDNCETYKWWCKDCGIK